MARGMKLKEIVAIALFLVIMMSCRMSVVAEPAAPDLSVEGVVLPYLVPQIYAGYWPGCFYYIDVTITNQGTSDASRFNVSFAVHLAGEIMPEYGRKKTVENLQQGANETLAFDFNPEYYGNYTLTITADCDNDIIELDETNNAKIVWLIGTIRCDNDGDGDVDYDDFLNFAGHYLMRFISPPYPTTDVDWDGDVDYDDFLLFGWYYLKSI